MPWWWNDSDSNLKKVFAFVPLFFYSNTSARKINITCLTGVFMKKFSFRLFSTLPPEEKKITLSTLFTLARIALTPFIVVAMVMGSWGPAFFLFVIASSFDVIDGNLARLLNQRTFLGACLDRSLK